MAVGKTKTGERVNFTIEKARSDSRILFTY